MGNDSFSSIFRKLADHKIERILFAFLDQGIFSGSNFLVNILLARWLSEAEYGAFAVSFSVYIIASSFQGGLILEPLSVFGPNIFANEFSAYINKQFHFHLKINIITSFILLLISFLFFSPIKEALIGVAFAVPFTFVIWLFRRICYINLQTKLAALISMTYSMILLISVFVLSAFNSLTPISFFFILALSSLITAVCFRTTFQIKFNWSELFKWGIWNDLDLMNNWNYGKWILVATISQSILDMAYIPLVALILDLRQAAGFRAMQNIILPIQQVQAAISMMMIPVLSKRSKISNVLQSKSILIVSSYYLLPAVLYSLFTVIFSKEIISVIYNSEYYNNYIWMVPLLLFSSILNSFLLSFAVALRAVKISQPLLWAKISTALITVLMGGAFTYWFGLDGVILALYIALFVEGIVLFAAVHKAHRVIHNEP